MKQGQIYEAPREKDQIEDYIHSIYPFTPDDDFDLYADGYNNALEMVLDFIDKM